MVKIVIDPGHSGKAEPGAVSGVYQEATFALDVTKRIKSYLLANYEGFEIKLTRETSLDVKQSLGSKVKIANDWKANSYISIHCNAHTGTATGFETFRYVKIADSKLQKLIHEEMALVNKKYELKDRGQKSADFHVIRETSMDAVLLEIAFIDNKKDILLLNNTKYMEEISISIAKGIVKFHNLPKKQVNEPVVEKKYYLKTGLMKDKSRALKLQQILKENDCISTIEVQ